MFRNVYPIFEAKKVLKKEMLENLRDYPRTLFDIQYQEYSDGILYGCRLETEDTVIPHFIYFQIHYTSVKFNKAPALNRMTFIASDSLIPEPFMLSWSCNM